MSATPNDPMQRDPLDEEVSRLLGVLSEEARQNSLSAVNRVVRSLMAGDAQTVTV